MNVCAIIKKYLEENKFDGLANRDLSCGCGVDDLMPCGAIELECEPAKGNWQDGFYVPMEEEKGE